MRLLDHFWTAIAKRAPLLSGLPNHINAEARAAQLATGILSAHDEAQGAARVDGLLALYRKWDAEQRHRFHLYLARNFLPEQTRLTEAARAYLSAPTVETAAELTAASVPPRQELLRRMNIIPGATELLVQMREALNLAGRETPELKPLEQDLDHLLGSWFNRGFLELRRLDWNTPAATLEKLIVYEAVHEMHGWNDLRRRLAPDRRCFGFFHPALPGDPVIFVEVALCIGLPAKIAPLLAAPVADDGAERADTAVFYSISKCQPGLRGMPFGNFLIRQVVEELRAELPQLTCYATLSPIPGFRRWLDRRLASGDESLLLESERAAFGKTPLKTFADHLEKNGQGDEAMQPVKPVLERLCAGYLTAAHGDSGPDDPVARFHLGNGARLERINWRSDLGTRRMKESYGLMANYRYDPRTIEATGEKFARGIVVYSPEIAAMLAPSAKNGHKNNHKRAIAAE